MSQLYGDVNSQVSSLPNDRQVAVCLFSNERQTYPTAVTWCWSQILERHSLHEVRSSKSGPMLGGYELKGTRCNENVVRRTLIQLDIDTQIVSSGEGGNPTILKKAPSIKAVLSALGEYEFFATSSHSHAPKHGILKYRLVILPDQDIPTAGDYRYVLEELDRRLDGGLDRNAWQYSQAFYLPSITPEHADDRFFLHNRGLPLPVQEFIDLGREGQLMRRNRDSMAGRVESLARDVNQKNRAPIHSSEEAIAELQRALDHLDPDMPRREWLYTIWSIHAHRLVEGYEIARQWSARGMKYDDKTFDTDYFSYDSSRSDAIGPSYVYHLARRVGEGVDSSQSEVREGDIYNSETFCRFSGGSLRYVHPARRWLRWDRTRWVYCEAREEMAVAKSVAAYLLDEASKSYKAAPNDPNTKRALNHARRSQDERRLSAMVNLATSKAEVAISDMNVLDSNPMYLGVKNGLVDLERGVLMHSAPSHLITKQCSVIFDPEAKCPRWIEFLSQVFLGDEELIAYVQRALGYSLTGRVDEEVLFFMFGFGANGKSVFVNTIYSVLNNYAGTAPPSLLSLRRNDDGGRATPEMARLSGVRFALVNETQSGDRLDEQMVKVLVSRERIAARFLHRDYFEFSPTHCLWLRSNHKPIIVGDDDGIWRRIHLIPFDRRFQPEEMDRDLESSLQAEAEGILAWMVRGTTDWLKVGLRPPGRVLQASNEYRRESDLLGQWLEEQVDTTQADFRTDEQAVYQSYRGWCVSANCRAMSKSQFTRKLAERGVQQGWAGKRTRVYVGLRLKLASVSSI